MGSVCSPQDHRPGEAARASYAFHFVRPHGGQLAQIAALIEAGSIRPIDKVFPFTEAKQALAYLAQGRARGKVVVQLPVS